MRILFLDIRCEQALCVSIEQRFLSTLRLCADSAIDRETLKTTEPLIVYKSLQSLPNAAGLLPEAPNRVVRPPGGSPEALEESIS